MLNGGQIVNDVPLSGLSAANSSPTQLTQATFFTATINAGSNVVYQWNFGDGTPPAVGAGATVTHTYAAAGAYTAIVTVTNNAGSLAAQTTAVVIAPAVNADLVVTQSYQLNFLNDITFTLTVHNLGPQAAANAIVSDTFPEGSTTWNWTCAASGGATCTASGSGNLYDTLTSFPDGGVVTYTVHGNLTNWSRWTNTVEVIPPAGITDAVPSNNRATVGRYQVFMMLIFYNATPR
jgi:uncharacterized repeat protein (TIGR01451 family)